MFNTLLVHPLFNLLVFIYSVIPGHDFGISVIILTVLVRLLLWPVVAKQLHSQKVMQKLGPKIAKARKDANGDKQKESLALMELYKEEGINPLAPLLPMFIQLPLLFALFFVLRDILKPGEITHLSYSFLRSFDTVKAIIADSNAFHATFFGLDLVKSNLILALAAGITQFYQSRQILPKDTSDPNTQAASMMSLIFPVITVLFAMKLPAALALYWVVTSLIAILQQHLALSKDVEEMEAKK